MLNKINNFLNKYSKFWLTIYTLICLISICKPHLASLVIFAFILGWYKCFIK